MKDSPPFWSIHYCLSVSYTHLDVYKRQQLPSSIEGIARKLLLLYTGPYIITQVKGNNTYETKTITNNKIKGVYNQSEMKHYYEDKAKTIRRIETINNLF